MTLDGQLDEEIWYVFDFVTLKHIMRRLCDEIDHKVLLPLQNPKLQIGEGGRVGDRCLRGEARYVFPRADCALLPVPNTTVEMLAELLPSRLRVELEKTGARGLTAIEMEVEENFGQSAVYRVGLP